MFRNADRTYAVLMDQLQDAYDEDLRLRTSGKICHEIASVQDRIQMLTGQIVSMLQPSYTNASIAYLRRQQTDSAA